MSTAAMQWCRYCKAYIRADATRCSACKRFLKGPDRGHDTVRDRPSTAGAWLHIVLSVIALIVLLSIWYVVHYLPDLH
jgi:hypothetical protein